MLCHFESEINNNNAVTISRIMLYMIVYQLGISIYLVNISKDKLAILITSCNVQLVIPKSSASEHFHNVHSFSQ